MTAEHHSSSIGPGGRAGQPDSRLAALEALLHGCGLDDVLPSTAGDRQEIAVLTADPRLAHRLADLAHEIRALGFDYVTLDLDTIEEPS